MLLVLLSVVSFAVILRCSLLRGGRIETVDIKDWEDKQRHIDIEIFRGLVDRDGCQYLRKTLSIKEFRVFQRKRIRMALRILRLVERNVDLLMDMGRLARVSSDSVRREEAEKLIAGAIQLRLNILEVSFCLLLQWLVPSWTVSFPAFMVRYDQLWCSLTRFDQGWQQSR
jgi:hypothetical protein